ncbi:MAG: response regulator [Terriglobales bacterium]
MADPIILVVDDEPSVADTAVMVLENEGYCALALYSAVDAIAMLNKIDPALILSDINMPEIDGVELALKARELCPRVRVLLMSGSESSETIGQRDSCKGCRFEVMAKPFGARVVGGFELSRLLAAQCAIIAYA